MKKPLVAEKILGCEAVTLAMFENQPVVTGHLEKNNKIVTSLVNVGFECVLNNLSLDYITGAELASYVKACYIVYVLPVIPKNEESGVHDGPSSAVKFDIKLISPNEIVKKIGRFLSKTQEANAA